MKKDIGITFNSASESIYFMVKEKTLSTNASFSLSKHDPILQTIALGLDIDVTDIVDTLKLFYKFIIPYI